MKGGESVFDYLHLLYCKWHKINPSPGGSYINFPDWIKNKETAINLINQKDNKCFQYAVTVALNYEEIRKYSERITNAKSFINKYNQKGIHFPSEKNDWIKCEKNNQKIALNVLYP